MTEPPDRARESDYERRPAGNIQPPRRVSRSSVKRRHAMMNALRTLDWVNAPRKEHADIRAEATRKRRKIVDGSGDRCESCDLKVRHSSLLHLHHVVPVARGGTNADENLALLCANCHASAHLVDRQLRGGGRPENKAALFILLRAA